MSTPNIPSFGDPSALDDTQPVDPAGVRRLNRRPIIIIAVIAAIALIAIAAGLASRADRNQQVAAQGDSNPVRKPATDVAAGIAQDAPNTDVIPIAGQPVPSFESSIDPLAQPTGQPVPGGNEQAAEPAAAQAELTPRQEYQRTRQQQFYQARLQSEQRLWTWGAGATAAPTRVDLEGNGQAGPGGLTRDTLATLASLQNANTQAPQLASLAGTAGSTSGLSGIAAGGADLSALLGGGDANRQADKESFGKRFEPNNGVLMAARTPALSPYELKRGSVIPAVMISGINSDLPGRIIGQVSENVWDSVSGRRLLIPQGTRLFGRYDSRVTHGQSRVLVVWTDLVFPDGSTLNLQGMPGTSAAGYAGFKDKVDWHWDVLFATALLTSAISTGITYATDSANDNNDTVQIEDTAQEEFAREFGRVANRALDKQLDVQPTLKIRPGYRFNVMVEKDIVLPPLAALAQR